MAFMEITFPGGKKVDAHMKGMVIHTDQSVYAGGEGSAPAPFDLFLASIGTCAGVYALGFCQSKGIPTEGLALTMGIEKDPTTHHMTQVSLQLTLPKDFPMKYEAAIMRAMDLCAVKKHMLSPPNFDIQVIKETL